MTTPFPTLLFNETRLQYRYGIYAAYGFVMAFYVFILVWGGAYLPPTFIAFVIYSDPAVLGFFFLGALMMLEKAEGVRLALSVTPIASRDYFLAKALPLTLLGLVAVGALGLLVHGRPDFPILMASVFVTSLFYIGIAVPIALHFRTVTSYLIGSSGLLLPVIVPAILAFMDPMPVWAMLVPTAAQLRLIMIGVGAGTEVPNAVMLMLASSTLGAIAAIWTGLRRLDRELARS